MNNFARMQTDEFKLEQLVKDLERQREYKRWLQALQNQKNLAQFDADFPPSKSRARSRGGSRRARSRRARSRRARSNSMTRYKSRSNTRSNRRRSAGSFDAFKFVKDVG